MGNSFGFVGLRKTLTNKEIFYYNKTGAITKISASIGNFPDLATIANLAANARIHCSFPSEVACRDWSHGHSGACHWLRWKGNF